jgi:hypothetical protein
MANLPLQPGQPVLPALPIQAPPAPRVLRAQTFSMLFQDTTLDPCQGEFTQIMEQFDPKENPGLSHTIRWWYTVCTHHRNMGRSVVHVHRRGNPRSSYHNSLTQYHITICQREGKDHWLHRHTSGWARHLRIATSGSGWPWSQSPHSRTLMYLPMRYVPLFLSVTGYTLE